MASQTFPLKAHLDIAIYGEQSARWVPTTVLQQCCCAYWIVTKFSQLLPPNIPLCLTYTVAKVGTKCNSFDHYGTEQKLPIFYRVFLGHYLLNISFSSLAHMKYCPRTKFAIMSLFLMAHAFAWSPVIGHAHTWSLPL
jgi:hypothetical protein